MKSTLHRKNSAITGGLHSSSNTSYNCNDMCACLFTCSFIRKFLVKQLHTLVILAIWCVRKLNSLYTLWVGIDVDAVVRSLLPTMSLYPCDTHNQFHVKVSSHYCEFVGKVKSRQRLQLLKDDWVYFTLPSVRGAKKEKKINLSPLLCSQLTRFNNVCQLN